MPGRFSVNYMMRLALDQARQAQSNGEVPVGAVLVLQDKTIILGNNSVIRQNDPTLHAEIEVIRKGCKIANNYRLINSELYVTLEPCSMCYGAITQARIRKLFFGAYDKNTGVCGSCNNLITSNCFNHKPEVIGGVLEKDCSLILKNFFKEKRN